MRLLRAALLACAMLAEACRAAGASDLDILDANNLAGYYAYLARVCLGLGVRGSIAS